MTPETLDTTMVVAQRVDAGALLIRCNEDSPLEMLVIASEAVDAEYDRAKANRDARDKLLEEVARAHGPFTLGRTRYWLAHPKTVKCKAILQAVQAVLEAVRGDEEAFARALSVNALKVGQCRSILGDKFSDHFETIVRDKLESGEVAPKELASAPADMVLR